jgi:lycopene cyclase domain-containing protein
VPNWRRAGLQAHSERPLGKRPEGIEANQVTFAYLMILLVSIAGMIALDWKFKLAFFRDLKVSAVTLVLGVAMFTAWDDMGIRQGIFFRGSGQWMTGLQLFPEYPIEELFFLILLNYLCLNILEFAKRVRGKK